MNQIEQERDVTILRPPGLSPANQLERKINHALRIKKRERYSYDEIMPQILAKTRKLVFEVSEELDLHSSVHEYDVPPETGIPSRAAMEWIKRSNVLMIFDPNDQEIAQAMACLRENPILSIILAATDNQYLDTRKEILETQVAHLIEPTNNVVQRIHSTSISWKHEEDLEPALKKALLYPYEAI